MQFITRDYLINQFKNYDREVAEPKYSGGGGGGGSASFNFATFNEIASLFLENGDQAIYDGDNYSV